MRSSLSCANQSSPCFVTQTLAAACTGLPAASAPEAISSTWPALLSSASHASRPRASVLPLHSAPRSFTSVRLS